MHVACLGHKNEHPDAPALVTFRMRTCAACTIVILAHTLFVSHTNTGNSCHSHCSIKCIRFFMQLKVLATLPVWTGDPERLFLKVERTFTVYWSTMFEEMLEALISIRAYRNALPDIWSIINKFAAPNSRRLQLVILQLYSLLCCPQLCIQTCLKFCYY